MSQDTYTPKLFLHCNTCKNGQLTVAISTENELLMLCEKCRQIVAVISEWPDRTNTHGGDCECDNCKVESETPKNSLN